MSVGIGYRPHNPKALNRVDGGSSFLSALEHAFGEMPAVIDSEAIGLLRGIEACGYIGASGLIDAINKFGAIELDAEW